LKKACEYHERAAECRTMVARTQNPEHKEMLAAMVATWENLAIEREALIARWRRIAALEASEVDAPAAGS
jgi:hypothetical protein